MPAHDPDMQLLHSKVAMDKFTKLWSQKTDAEIWIEDKPKWNSDASVQILKDAEKVKNLLKVVMPKGFSDK